MIRKRCVLVLLLLLSNALCSGASGLRPEAFKHHSNQRSWWKAQAFCREKYTDLVTIEGEEENQDFVSGVGWMGLYRENSSSEWKWSRGGVIANFTIWDTNHPKNGENCAFKYKYTKTWRSDHCGSAHSVMCFNEKLVLVTENKTWEQALMHCRDLEAVHSSKPGSAYQNHRFDLATLLTPDDHVYAREKAQQATTQEVWTGLRYLAGRWMWVSGGGRVQYGDIKSCQGTTFCGVLVKNGSTLFETTDCNWRRNFFCSKKP